MNTLEIDELCKDLKSSLTINLDIIVDNITFEESKKSPRVGFEFFLIKNINRKRKFEAGVIESKAGFVDKSPKLG